MTDTQPARLPEKDDKRTFLQKVAEFIHPGPDSTAELIETLADAEDNNVIGAESRFMLEGVLRMAEMSAGDVMVPATRMDLLDIDAPPERLMEVVLDTGHSRVPVFERDRENIIGILLAKDLLKLRRAPELHLRTLLRPAFFIPESKGLNDIAILFVLFDVEVIFMYPWAVNFQTLGLFGLVEMFLFLAFVLAGFFYVIKKGALKWE